MYDLDCVAWRPRLSLIDHSGLVTGMSTSPANIARSPMSCFLFVTAFRTSCYTQCTDVLKSIFHAVYTDSPAFTLLVIYLGVYYWIHQLVRSDDRFVSAVKRERKDNLRASDDRFVSAVKRERKDNLRATCCWRIFPGMEQPGRSSHSNATCCSACNNVSLCSPEAYQTQHNISVLL